jgi:hypothetical protein
MITSVGYCIRSLINQQKVENKQAKKNSLLLFFSW